MDLPELLPDNVGKCLYRLRVGGTAFKQADMAGALGTDVSRISRIEKGDLRPSAVEVASYLRKFDTDEGREYGKYLGQQWKKFARPDFWHPDRRPLFEADQTIALLDRYTTEHDLDPTLVAQLDMLRASLQEAARFLESIAHSLGFVGDIGVGKFTALCVLTDLILRVRPREATPGAGSGKNVVLETNSGGATICQARLKQVPGTRFGIIVQPQPHEEIFNSVSELCAGLWERASAMPRGEAEKGVSPETGRALRNMADLSRWLMYRDRCWA